MRLETATVRSRPACWLLAALAVFWAGAGWWIVIEGNLHLSLDRRSRYPVLVDGLPALFMALIFLLLSTITAMLLLKNMSAGRVGHGLLLLVNIGVPLVYWMLV